MQNIANNKYAIEGKEAYDQIVDLQPKAVLHLATWNGAKVEHEAGDNVINHLVDHLDVEIRLIFEWFDSDDVADVNKVIVDDHGVDAHVVNSGCWTNYSDGALDESSGDENDVVFRDAVDVGDVDAFPEGGILVVKFLKAFVSHHVLRFLVVNYTVKLGTHYDHSEDR